LGSERTIEVAKTLGIPFALERPNAHTEFAYDAVAQEAKAVGIELPKGHDHRENQRYLSHEKVEYDGASALLCPSDFVERTFRERGFADRKLIRHQYGFDRERCFPTLGELPTNDLGGLKMLYAGVCEPRKGLHRALEAWFESGAYRRGRFQICGEFVPGYREALAEWLEHPSVEVMGHRRDLPEIMRQADVFVLSSVEEGSALVTYEARGSGCVLLVSDSTGAICCDGVNGLLHPTGDVRKLGEQIAMLDSDPKLLGRLRQESLSDYNQLTWDHAGRVLADCYHEILERARSDS
jgi:glycosyltransferase involved in cell wall biosynthesis